MKISESLPAGISGRFRHDIRGTIAIMSAVSMATIIGAAAIAVDIGSLYTERRQAQGAVDLAAIAAAADLDRAHAAAEATLRVNGLPAPPRLIVETGNYRPDPSLPPEARFVVGAEPRNAARVYLEKQGATYFARALSLEAPRMSVRGLAINAELANFSLGSRLLALREGAVNRLLGALTGSNVDLTVMDYNALASADVKLLNFLDVLAGEMNLTAATYNDVLGTSASIGDIVSAMAAVTNAEGSGNDLAIALSTLQSALGTSAVSVPLQKVINLGPLGDLIVGSPAPGLDATYSALGLVTAAAAMADGENQVALDFGASVPGLLGLTIAVAVGEPMQNSGWVAVGTSGALVRTAQTRISLRATVGGTGLLAGAELKLPIDIEVAPAEARLDDVVCAPDGAEAVAMSARPGIAVGRIGEGDAGASEVQMANILSTAIARVQGRARVEIADTSWTPIAFSKDDIANRTIKSVSSSNLTDSLVSSLVGELELKVQVLGLGVGLGPTISNLVSSTLGGVTQPLDAVVSSLLKALGVHSGEADVRVHGALCGGARLAG
jgi:uncharacterized membrane protein